MHETFTDESDKNLDEEVQGDQFVTSDMHETPVDESDNDSDADVDDYHFVSYDMHGTPQIDTDSDFLDSFEIIEQNE